MKFLLLSLLLTSNLSLADQALERKGIADLKKATIQLAQSSLQCTSNEDCVAIALGDRACGGPSGYTFTSKTNPNLEEVNYLADRTGVKEAEYNLKNQVVSICLFEMPVRTECVKNTCVKK